MQAFTRDNVTLITNPIDCFTETGIRTKCGTLHEVDTIILATGFDPAASYQTFQAYGLNSTDESLQDEWKDTPHAYLTITYPNYPNLFFLMGPGSILGIGSVLFTSECSCSYVTDAIRKMLDKGIKSIDVKKHVSDEYWAWVQEMMKTKVFNLPTCTSWYRNDRGINYTLWPSFPSHFWWVTRKINLADYNITY